MQTEEIYYKVILYLERVIIRFNVPSYFNHKKISV